MMVADIDLVSPPSLDSKGSGSRVLHTDRQRQNLGIVQLLVGRGCFMGSGYLISVILARGLGPTEYGIYGVVMSLLLWIEMVGSAGVPGATAKLLPQYQGRSSEVEQTARTLLVIVSVVLFSLCWWLAPVAAGIFKISTGTLLFRLAILDVPFNGVYLAYQGILNGHRQFGALSAGMIVYGLTKLTGILILLRLGLSVSGALIVNAMATVGVLVYLLIKYPPGNLKAACPLLVTMLRIAVPMGLYLASLQVLLSLDLWCLKSLNSGSGEVIGIYAAALNVARVLLVIPSVLSGVLFASLSWAIARSDKVAAQQLLKGASRIAFVIIVPSCALVASHSEGVMRLLYSGVYASGGLYLSLQVLAFGLMAFLDLFFHALMAGGKQNQSAAILSTSIPLALLFNLVLIPRLGATGAAISLVLTLLTGTLAAAVFAYRRFGALIRASTVGRVILGTAVIAFVSMHVRVTGFWLVLEFAGLLVVYAVLLTLLKELSREDLAFLSSWKSGTRHA